MEVDDRRARMDDTLDLVGIVRARVEKAGKRGGKFAFLTLSRPDRRGRTHGLSRIAEECVTSLSRALRCRSPRCAPAVAMKSGCRLRSVKPIARRPGLHGAIRRWIACAWLPGADPGLADCRCTGRAPGRRTRRVTRGVADGDGQGRAKFRLSECSPTDVARCRRSRARPASTGSVAA